MLACEIRPKSRKKLLVLVFYRPPNTNLDYIKQLKKALTLASKAKFDSLIVCGDFNLPHIDWSTGVATNNDSIHNFFTKTVKDNYLWQLVDFPTRINNTLDLLLTNIPEKVINVHGFEDIISTDHTLISFDVDFKICKKPKVKRSVYNFKNANWLGLKQVLANIPWELGFVSDDINTLLSSWSESFISAVNDHVPKRTSRCMYDPPWIDKELLALLKKKNIQRKKSRKSKSPEAIAKFKQLRRESKILIAKKKIEHANKMKNSVFENPKRFWSYVKSSTRSSQSPNFLRNGQSYTTDSREKANLLNTFFHSVFNPSNIEPPASLYHLQHGFLHGRSTVTQLLEVYHNIIETVASGREVDIIYLDLSKAFDKVPHSLLLLKLNSYGISGSLLSWFSSYLTDRYQRVVLDGVYSDWLPITSGVPQGPPR